MHGEGEGLLGMTLSEVNPRNQVVVVTINGGITVSSHLNTLGIHSGDTMVVVDRAPFGGPVLVEVHGSRVALGRGVARKVVVESAGAPKPLVD